MRFQRLLTVPPLLLFASLASADAITGRVVDANGVGVAGVDIDFIKLGGGGGNPHELNDGTDANGNFVTTVDPGIYEVLFFPPTPPVTTLLAGSVTPVSISGTVNMGTITLVAGASLQGTVQNDASAPVGGVKISVYKTNTEALVLMKNNTSSAFGTFNIAVPKNQPLRAEFLTSGVIGQTLAPQAILGTIPGNTNMGTLTLHTGFHVTGTVRRENGTAVFGADVDAITPANLTLFTPNDNSNTLGIFDVIIPAGSYQLSITRPTGQVLVDIELNNVLVSAATDVGTVTLRNGVFLTGGVRDGLGNPVVAADVNAIEVATGLPLALGADNTNATGFYSVVVPTGLLHIRFAPPGPHTLLDTVQYRNVLVTGNTTRNAVLNRKSLTPSNQGNATITGPIILPFAHGTPGSGLSVPHQEGHFASSGSTTTMTGSSSIGSTGGSTAGISASSVSLQVFGGRPGASAELLLGIEEHALASAPSLHLVRPTARIPVVLDAEGKAQVTLPLADITVAGRTTFTQFLVIDTGAQRGFALSQVLAIQIPQ